MYGILVRVHLVSRSSSRKKPPEASEPPKVKKAQLDVMAYKLRMHVRQGNDSVDNMKEGNETL